MPSRPRRARSAACRSRTPAPSPATSATPRRRPTACRRCSRSAPRSSCRARAATRRLPLEDFVLGSRRTARREAELVSALHIPARAAGARSVFLKLGGRRYLVISITMVAVADRRSTPAAPSPMPASPSAAARRWPSACRRSKRACVGRDAATLAACVEPGDLAPLTPIDDLRASGEYRLDATADAAAPRPARRSRHDRARPRSPADRRACRSTAASASSSATRRGGSPTRCATSSA